MWHRNVLRIRCLCLVCPCFHFVAPRSRFFVPRALRNSTNAECSPLFLNPAFLRLCSRSPELPYYLHCAPYRHTPMLTNSPSSAEPHAYAWCLGLLQNSLCLQLIGDECWSPRFHHPDSPSLTGWMLRAVLCCFVAQLAILVTDYCNAAPASYLSARMTSEERWMGTV